MNNIQNMGALAPKYDIRDYMVAAMVAEYPDEYELPWRPTIKNQGSIGSCVAHVTSEILEYFNHQEANISEPLSTDFIYGMQGVALGRTERGMFLRDACKIAQQYGDCFKASINTNTEQPKCTEKLKEKLNNDIYQEAYNFHIDSYAKCKDENAVKHAILNYGPVLASIKWHNKSKITNEGIIQFDTSVDGGYHAIMIYGWNKNGWLCQNSWGKMWGKQGTFILPYDIKLVEAWSFVDASNSDIVIPVKYKWTNIFYKAFNWLINLFKHIFP